MKSSGDFQQHRCLENEFLQARLQADWAEFRTIGRASVTNCVREPSRSDFASSVQNLTKAGCREDVLLPCLLVFLNSQNEEVAFPWAAKLNPIPNALKKIRDTIQEAMESPGFQTLESHWCEPSLATFSDFVCAQRSFLKSATKYELELRFILKGLSPKDLVQQYGKAIICMYVQAVLRRVSSQLTVLLDCFRGSDAEIGKDLNLTRDLQDFEKKYPDFCEQTRDFLDIEHKSLPPKLPVLDWAQFRKTGRF